MMMWRILCRWDNERPRNRPFDEHVFTHFSHKLPRAPTPPTALGLPVKPLAGPQLRTTAVDLAVVLQSLLVAGWLDD